MKKFVIVGGGSAGAITASYLKKYWGDHAEVIVVYDHRNPGIGVGESLTPNIYDYLNYVGITRDEIVKFVNGTVKLGLSFKNWLGDGTSFYHPFIQNPLDVYPDLNFDSVYDIVNNQYDYDICYGSSVLDNNLIPSDTSAIQSLHIDATLLSKVIFEKFQDHLVVIDGVVVDTIKEGKDCIKELVLQDGRKIEGDFFIDASGFQSILFKHTGSKWVDMSDWLPIDRCIPNPMQYSFVEQPPHTTSEASKDGWILQVPLSNRWGTGYLFSSKFTSEQNAFDQFESFLNKTYDSTLTNTSKVLKFNSGYWEQQWVGNCICVGLSSGFAEPLEATNILHTISQIRKFTDMFTFKYQEYDIKKYNHFMSEFYKNIYLYIRFCYTTGRTDSDFWEYMTNNTPEEVKDIEQKVRYEPLTGHTFSIGPFNHRNFTKVAWGLNKIDIESYRDWLVKRNAVKSGRRLSRDNFDNKVHLSNKLLNHKDYINSILNKV